jgi:hypothetical protein
MNPNVWLKYLHDADLMLFDGRVLAQNGWFVVRSLLPAGKTARF